MPQILELPKPKSHLNKGQRGWLWSYSTQLKKEEKKKELSRNAMLLSVMSWRPKR